MKIVIEDNTINYVDNNHLNCQFKGARGPKGDPGQGIIPGGTTGQVLGKLSNDDYNMAWIDQVAAVSNIELYVKNNTGTSLTKGQVVYISGADGNNPNISLAIATTEMGSSKTIGFLKQNLANGEHGYVISEGIFDGVDTNNAIAAGDPMWLSATTPGGVVYGLVNKPSAPNHLVFLGVVLRKQINNGKVYVKVQNGFELGELHDVYNGAKTTPVGDDALLLRDSADSNLWKRLTWTNALAGVKSHMDTFKSVANGYASLDGAGKVPASELPSYVDDVVEVANYAALPGTGETGKIYITLDDNKCYRWSGTVYIQVAQGVDTLTTTGTSGAATLVGSTLNIPQYQGVLTNPVTGTGTSGQVAYFNGTSAVTGSNNLFWDSVNNTLGVNRTPIVTLDIATTFNTTITPLNSVPNVATSVIIGNTGTNSVLAIGQNNTLQAWIQARSRLANQAANTLLLNPLGGNVLINNTDGTGRLTVRGSGTTSATTALLVQNSTPTEVFTIKDNGWIGVGASNISLYPYSSIGTPNLFGRGMAIAHNFAGAAGTGIAVVNAQETGRTATSGESILIRMVEGFAPTSGTGTFISTAITGTINQTGGANGITRGLYVNPTLTAAADWRSIEFSNNTGWGIYGAGTANNYLGGSLGIGSTPIAGANLAINKNITGAIISYGIRNEGTIQLDSTNGAIGYHTNLNTVASYTTLGGVSHYFASQGTFGAGTSVAEQNGFFAQNNLIGANLNTGFRGRIPSGSGRWNLYMDGTAANYLAGNTSIGTTTSSGRLTVQGSGTTSATKAFVVNNSTPTALLEILDNGRINQTIPGASNNTIFGTSAGGSASLSGSFNTFYGVNAGTGNTTGAGNSLIGYNAGSSLTTGGNNVYVGNSAGNANQTATTNTAIGVFAMLNHTTGNENIAKGINAARFYADGTTSATSFSFCTYLGAACRVSAAGVTNEIVIGSSAIGNGSNTVTLGNTSITATYLRGNINYTDGGNFVFGTTTGTKIGTATSQKIGLWNATPIVQPTTAVAAATRVGGGGTTVTDTDTFDGYTIAQLVKALRNMGALA